MDALKILPPSEAGRVTRILRAALEAVNPGRAVLAQVRWDGSRLEVGERGYWLDAVGRVLVIAVGKAAVEMARAVETRLGDRLSAGLVVAKHLPDAQDSRLGQKWQLLCGDHPVPGENSLYAGRRVAQLLAETREDDLVLFLISGGGSALLTLPAAEIALDDLQAVTRALLACGADIGEMNTVRKHLDGVKGGGLARLAFPARAAALILSDVIDSPLDVIASGPTVADPTTFSDAMGVLRKYALLESVPPAVWAVLQTGEAGRLPETVKPGDACLTRTYNLIVGSNLLAARAALEQAQAEGMNTLLLTTALQGEARQAGQMLAGVLRRMAETGQPVARPACVVAGGETTVTLLGKGLGGRNQELALGAVAGLAGLRGAALITLATDGEDGPTDAAGALVDGTTLDKAGKIDMSPEDYLWRNDAYHFFERLGALIHTGPTGTNVNDLTFLFTFSLP